MADYDFDMGILGGGAAGLTVTAGAARLGAKTLLIEKEKALGGDCLHHGCVPSKTLIHSARVYHTLKNAPAFGLPAVDCPPVSYDAVVQRIRSVIEKIQRHDSEERFCGLGARVLYGEPRFLDDHTIRLDGGTYSAKTWVLATGSSPAVPPIEGLAGTPYITNREIFSLERLPRSMIILGAGPIATELAQAFCRLGTQVQVVQRSGQILSKEDRDLADEIMGVLAREGVTFHLNASVLRVRDLGPEREVVIRQGERDIPLTAETLFIALGRTADLEGLALEKAGVAHSRKGVQVDQRLRTTRSHIYAAGDVTGAYQFTHAAGYEGGIVISNAVFHLPRKADYTFLPWCTYTDPELASIGMNEKRAKEGGIPYTVISEAFEDNDRSLAEGEGAGRVKVLLDKDEKPLGVQILGPKAGELLGEWVAVLNGKVKLSTLAGAIHPYPTLGEINKRVAGTFLSPKIFSERVKKGLKLFFHFKGRACEIETSQRED